MGDLPQSPRPGEPPPSRTGSKPLFLSTDSCYRTTTIPGSKARASGVLPGGEDVESDLVAEGLHVRELALVPETPEEREPNAAAVKIPGKIEEMSLHRELRLAKGRPYADVDDRLVACVLHIDLTGIDPGGQKERTRRLDVCRGEAEGSAATRPAHDLALDRVGTPEEPRRLREVAALERAPDLRRRHGNTIDGRRGNRVRPEPELAPEPLEERGIAAGAAPEPMIEADDDVPRLQRLHEDARSEEHTSELQSLAYLVCRLLLEKKKKKIECDYDDTRDRQ